MREFFRGWRRKVGCFTLILACAVTVGWMRSFVVDDFIVFDFKYDVGNWLLSGLGTENQSLVLYGFRKEAEPDLESDLTEVSRASSGTAISDTEPSTMEIELADAPSNSEVLTAQLDPESSQGTEPADALSASFESESAANEWIVDGVSGSISPHKTVISCFFPSHVPLVTMSFSGVAIPLTFLSAYLILWKPRKRMGPGNA